MYSSIVWLTVTLFVMWIAQFILDKQITVTPSYKVTYNLNGSIRQVRCKRTGQFRPVINAVNEINQYYS